MPEEGADLPGPYNPDYVPYLWGIFAALDDPLVRLIVMMKAAQIGWTYGLIGFLGKRIDTQPSAILMMFAKDGAAREFSDEKLVPAIRSTPALNKKINVNTRKKDGSRALFKKFPGGFLKLFGSNSVSNVKSTPAPLVIVEEPDDTCDNIKEQGDAIRLARERFKRYRGGKMVLGGTPSIKGISRIEEHIELSDQRVLPISCHDCDEKHVLDFEYVSWVNRDEGVEHPVYKMALPDSAIYSCPHCGSAWDDWQRQQNVINTVKAAASDGDPYYGWVPTVETFGGVVGFKELNELYVCLPGTRLADVVCDYLEAKNDAESGDQSGIIVFTNNKLARPYEYEGTAPETTELEDRAEDYAENTVPKRGLIITAGVDVQHDRFHINVWAYGRGEEGFLVTRRVIYAKTKVTDETDPAWKELESFLFTTLFEHESGFKLRISATTMDASDGQTSDQVYKFVRKNQRFNIMAGKGSSDLQYDKEIFSRPKQIDTKGHRHSKAAKYGLQVFMIGTHKAKDLLIGENGRLTLLGSGPGRMHWYNVDVEWYDQITSEIKAPHRSIRKKLVWQVRSGVRNEDLDCTVYSLHAARSLRINLMTEKQWDDLERKLMQQDLFTEEQKPDEQSNASFRNKSTRKKRGGFVNRYKN